MPDLSQSVLPSDTPTSPAVLPATGEAMTGGTPLSVEQKEYLQGFAAGLQAVATVQGAAQQASATGDDAEALWFNTPMDEVCREERIKIEADPFDIWDRMVDLAARNAPPEDGDIFRYKYHGLFWVAPAQESFMVRIRIPGNILRADQMRAIARIARDCGNGGAAITSRGAIQVRGIAPRDSLEVLKQLAECGLSSRGAGADNIRNVTNGPLSGLDAGELIDTRALARDMQFYLYHHRETYALPRKFNIAFDGAGTLSNAADTNDIGFIACRALLPSTDAAGDDVRFRVVLGGMTGHTYFGTDYGIYVSPHQAIDVAGAMVHVFAQHGNRTDRKQARLRHLLEKIGVEAFLSLTEERLGWALPRGAASDYTPRPPVDKMGHIGLHPQKQAGKHYAGLAIPVGLMSVETMEALAGLAERFCQGEIRLTVWQNALLPNIPDTQLEAFKTAAAGAGIAFAADAQPGALVACTGNSGCRFAESDTKAHALEIHRTLNGKFTVTHPINIHLTGCPNSCAQHYIGDIGFIGTQMPVAADGQRVEGYNVFVGGGTDHEQGIGRSLADSVPAANIPGMVEQLLGNYLRERSGDETFVTFARRLPVAALREFAGMTDV